MLTLPVQAGRDFERVPAGIHAAICNLVVDAGLQPGSQQYPQPKRKLYLRFEVPGSRITYQHDGKDVEGPLCIGSWYTASMNAKAILRQHLEGWRGKKFTDEEAGAFDISAVLGKPCTLVVQESEKGGKTRSDIKMIAPAQKGASSAAENPLLLYLNDGDQARLGALPEWLQKRITAQIQPEPASESTASEMAAEGWGGTAADDDIPF